MLQAAAGADPASVAGAGAPGFGAQLLAQANAPGRANFQAPGGGRAGHQEG